MLPSLEGKVCLVTGGAHGIGSAIVLALVESKATVAIDYSHSKALAEKLAAEICRAGGHARLYHADVANLDEVNAMADSVRKELGPVLVLVNNAGITRDRTFRKMTRQDWDEVIDVDLGGAFNATTAVVPHMMDAGWGRIISISSIIGQMGGFGQTNYAAAKAGLIGWTKALARELAGKGITVNVVAPGFVETDMTAVIPSDVRTKITAGIPMGRFGLPEEIAPIVSFLASPTASYITGQCIGVNGGHYM